MSMKEWMELDIDNLELEQVTEIEKQRVKQHVFKKRKKAPIWKSLSVAAVLLISATTVTTFAFPSLASQIPFMNNVISYFDDDYGQYTNFESFSDDLGLVDSDNGVSILIDHAVYDGTNIIVSYALKTESSLGKSLSVSGGNWFDVKGANGMSGSDKIIQVDNNHYIGVAELTPFFKDSEHPETIEVTWEPKAFYNHETTMEVKGDWSFNFSLSRLEGTVLAVNKTVESSGVNLALNSIEFTDVSTVLSYKQFANDELMKSWLSVTPVFTVKDNLGNIYVDGTSGGGQTSDDFKTFTGTTSFGAIKDGATKLFIEPTAIASLENGRGHEEIPLSVIVIELTSK
ncbi:DUF4179 domain-containing protein [Solibacillus daqui]|uniref:DUF4179 domain-containing protein n=1 Tax=Solibacillus daqui TaxID=2912187 RepID=UPI0023659115|nr:DUF4179 domain-containing protein [Solibacillus daqui]